MISRRRKVSLDSKFRSSYQPRKIMLRKLALKTEKKVHVWVLQRKIYLSEFIAISTLYTMYKVRCNSAIRSALALDAVKNSVVGSTYKEELTLIPYVSSIKTIHT